MTQMTTLKNWNWVVQIEPSDISNEIRTRRCWCLSKAHPGMFTTIAVTHVERKKIQKGQER